MIVSSVSPTPFALLRRARNFEYYDDRALQTFSDYDDPVKALTPECRRVLDAISSSNSTSHSVPELSMASPTSPTDASWTRFEDIGFSTLLDGTADTNGHAGKQSESRPRRSEGVRSGKGGITDLGRPATPSWADFMSSGFSDDDSTRAPTSLLLPPEQMLPPLSPGRTQSSQSRSQGMREDSNEPGELAGITTADIDETFWWVWMTSLAQEEPASRKAVFGRCAFVETAISEARWLIVEEQLKGAAPPPETAVIVAPKKSRFATFTKRSRRSSVGRKSPTPQMSYQSMPAQSTRTIGPDQQAKVQAAAAALVQQKIDEEEESMPGRRRGRTNENDDSKTQSVMTLGLQPMLAKEASPALQWARKFDKETTRQQYLGDNSTGKGLATGHSPSASTLNLETALSAGEATRRAQGKDSLDKQLPAPPSDALYGYGEPSQPVVSGQATYEQEPPAQQAAVHDSSMAAVAAITQGPSHPVDPAESSQPQVQSFADTTDSMFNQTPTSPTSQIQRMPVGRSSVDRVTSNQQPPMAPVRPSIDQRPATPKKTPAAIAAAAAASPRRTSPVESKKSPAQDMAARKASTKGFRGMFNNNKRKTQAPETLAAQKAMNGSTLSVEKPQRTSSFLRRNKPASPSPAAAPVAAMPAPAPAPTTQPEAPRPPFVEQERPMSASDEAARIRDNYYSRFEGGEPGPEETTDDAPQYGHAEEQMPLEPPQPQFTANANDSSARFSNFTQGPMEDVPAFVPEEEPVAHQERPPSPPRPMPGSFTTRAAAFLAPDRAAPQPPPQVETPAVQTSEFRTPMETLDTDPMDEQRTPTARSAAPPAYQSTEELTALPAPKPQQRQPVRQESGASLSQQQSNESAADRWAQIRKNAAERRTSEDQAARRSDSAQRSHAHSVATEKTDESEASGEESK